MNIRTVEGLLARRVDIDEILRLRAENERLEQEAEWLANRCREFCMAHNWCAECPMCSGGLYKKDIICECGAQIEQRFERFEKNMVQNWRKAARRELDKQRQERP